MSASEEEEEDDEAALHTGMRHCPEPGGAGFVPRGDLLRGKITNFGCFPQFLES